MKISSLTVSSTPLTSQPSQPAQAAPAAASDDPSGPPPIAADHAAYTPSAELVQLLNLVAQQPEVRAALVQAAQERLQQGWYTTPAAAAETASAMLNSVDE